MSKFQKTMNNITWGVIEKVVMLALPFVTKTVFINTFGVEYVGLTSLITSLLNMLNLAELGISSALVFSMYEPVAKNDKTKTCALLNLYKKSYNAIGWIVLLLGVCILPFLNELMDSDITDDVNIYAVFFILLLNTVVSYWMFAYKHSLFIVFLRKDIISKLSIFLSVFLNLIQIIIMLSASDLYIYCLSSLFFTVLNNLGVNYLSKKYYNDYTTYGEVDKEDKSKIITSIKGLILAKVGGTVLLSVDNIIISIYLGLNMLGIYNNYYYIFTAINGFLGIISSSLTPSIGSSLATKTNDEQYKEFSIINFLYMWIVSFSTICLATLYQPFINLWLGETFLFSNEIAILFAIYFFVFKWGDVLAMYRTAAGLWWQTKYLPLISSIVNLTLNVILIQKIGISGVLISTIVGILFVYFPGFIVAIFKSIFTKKEQLKHYIFKQIIYLVVTILSAVIVYTICNLIPNEGFVGFVCMGVACVILSNILLFMFYKNSNEFKDSIMFLKRTLRKE